MEPHRILDDSYKNIRPVSLDRCGTPGRRSRVRVERRRQAVVHGHRRVAAVPLVAPGAVHAPVTWQIECRTASFEGGTSRLPSESGFMMRDAPTDDRPCEDREKPVSLPATDPDE